MANLAAPFLTAAVSIPLVSAAFAGFGSRGQNARGVGIGALALSFLLSLEAARELAVSGAASLSEPGLLPVLPSLFVADALNAVTMSLFVALALVTLIAAPRRDADGGAVSTVLVLTGCTLAAYAAVHPLLFLAAWFGTSIPYMASSRDRKVAVRPAIELGASAIFLGAAFLLRTSSLAHGLSLACLLIAVVLRVGLLPFHKVSVDRIETGPLLPAGLLMNSHLGTFLIIRFGLTLFPELTHPGFLLQWTALECLSVLALITVIYNAILALVEHSPRRILALVLASQCCAMFAGLTIARPEGSMGGLMQWLVLALCSTVLLLICRAIEVRIDHPLGGDRLFGLSGQMPRMAVFFAVNALALVGLPGTLGFPGEDLLVHGILSARPVLGLVVPVAIAMNAWSLYRLFSRLFLGPAIPAWSSAPDALPRERWVFSAVLIPLVFGGLMPERIVALRTGAADALTALTVTIASMPIAPGRLLQNDADR